MVAKSPNDDHCGSSSAQDHLLVLDPSKRFTAEDALRHPFLLSVNAAAEKVPRDDVPRVSSVKPWVVAGCR